MPIILPENPSELAEWIHTNRDGTIVKWKFYENDSGKYYAKKRGNFAGFDVQWNEETNNPDLCIFWDCKEDRKWEKGSMHFFPITQPKIPIGETLIMEKHKKKNLDNISDSRIICQRKIRFTKEPCFLNGKIDQCWKEHS